MSDKLRWAWTNISMDLHNASRHRIIGVPGLAASFGFVAALASTPPADFVVANQGAREDEATGYVRSR